ncbi:MAG: hypothetical protein H0U98_04925 [Alphaproteobacteria bacterium]|nr:hypothetical protein [Alphaproteobacteria bacterium]
MSHILNAGAALVLVALVTGTMPPLSPHWRVMAADLHQARLQAQVKSRVKAAVFALLHGKKG